MNLIQKRIARIRCVIRILDDWELETWPYSCKGAQQYVGNPRCIVASLPMARRGILRIIFVIGPLRFLVLSLLLRSTITFREEWEQLKIERGQKNALGVLVAHDRIETRTFVRGALRARYLAVPSC